MRSFLWQLAIWGELIHILFDEIAYTRLKIKTLYVIKKGFSHEIPK